MSDFAQQDASDEKPLFVLADIVHQDLTPNLTTVIAAIEQLSVAEQQQLIDYLLQLPVGKRHFLNQVLADRPHYPLGLTSLGQTAAVGWKQEKRIVKERDNGVIDTYVEYWFNCELWSDKEQQWKHKSCYVCQHPEGRLPSASAARKIELLNRQIAHKRPYRETLQLLKKQHKLEQWEAEL
ncbi:MAG TPA: hypothetical protein V6C65_14970 [Allocoleopsis sp.]